MPTGSGHSDVASARPGSYAQTGDGHGGGSEGGAAAVSATVEALSDMALCAPSVCT